ncbi:unnamed protein product [Vicia faba]|uniref:Uncharacterized protein n=1 Tax=Vicia faba TaxID=3906 RepID=A0AAV0YTI9_VICFA|nr:unnamed protein product [Vicia faba]
MAEAVIEVVLDNLSSLIQKEIGLFLDLKNMDKLRNSLHTSIPPPQPLLFNNRATPATTTFSAASGLLQITRIDDDDLVASQQRFDETQTANPQPIQQQHRTSPGRPSLGSCPSWPDAGSASDYCFILQRLPYGLVQLKALQYLSLKCCDSLSSLPPHIRKLASRKTLTMYLVGKKKGFLLAELGQTNLVGDLVGAK